MGNPDCLTTLGVDEEGQLTIETLELKEIHTEEEARQQAYDIGYFSGRLLARQDARRGLAAHPAFDSYLVRTAAEEYCAQDYWDVFENAYEGGYEDGYAVGYEQGKMLAGKQTE